MRARTALAPCAPDPERQMDTTSIGIIGIGRLGEALGRAALALPGTGALHVSRRSAPRVARLQAADPRVLPSDPEVILQACEIVVLALRPDDARAALARLRFEPRHHVISAMAEIGLEELRDLTRGAASTCRILAMPSVADGGQLLPRYPRTDAADHLFGNRNRFLEVGSETELMTYWAITGLLSSAMMVGHVAEAWLVRAGIDRNGATAYTRAIYSDVHAAAADGFASGMDHVSTPGGLNVMMRERLQAAGFDTTLEDGLEAIHRRLLDRMARPAPQAPNPQIKTGDAPHG